MASGVTDSRGLQKPLPAEIDVCGLTHRGRVRSENADHFLIASFHRAMQVHNSSIPHTAFSALSADSRGYVFLVADGVGAFAEAADGSARAIRSVAQYLVDMSEVSLSTDPEREQEIVAVFRERHAFAPGQRIRLRPRADCVHLFDSSSGQRI